MTDHTNPATNTPVRRWNDAFVTNYGNVRLMIFTLAEANVIAETGEDEDFELTFEEHVAVTAGVAHRTHLDGTVHERRLQNVGIRYTPKGRPRNEEKLLLLTPDAAVALHRVLTLALGELAQANLPR